ncbi:hypothetical protein [Clostridium sp. YIM B02569]|uniref:hypothetical protein n=1 Tax=Clostridium sp. YIM B02569 TaxID=2911967 RepID=UPI001EEAABCE|nr:hypothetical protein [Clostridium sp. YIM B02569]
MGSKCYTKFGMRASGELRFEINCNLATKELSYIFENCIDEDINCIAIQLTYDDIELMKPYINVDDFEIYRNVSRHVSSDMALLLYLDGWTMEFEGISESEIPIIRLSSDYYGYDMQPPVEKLYKFLVDEYLSKNKIYRNYYGK